MHPFGVASFGRATRAASIFTCTEDIATNIFLCRAAPRSPKVGSWAGAGRQAAVGVVDKVFLGFSQEQVQLRLWSRSRWSGRPCVLSGTSSSSPRSSQWRSRSSTECGPSDSTGAVLVGAVCVVTVQKTEEVPQLQFIDKVAVQTSTSGGYGVLPVCEGFFLLLAAFFRTPLRS